MTIVYTTFAVIAAAVVASGLLAAEELVRLRRKLPVRRAVSMPAAAHFRNMLSNACIGVFWLTHFWGTFAAQCTAGSIMTGILAWNVWLTVRTRRPRVTRKG
jgi:hypothetical protein